MKNAFRISYFCGIGLLFVLNFLCVLNTMNVSFFPFHAFTVESSSMSPTFDQGDILIEKRYEGDDLVVNEDYRNNSIITFTMTSESGQTVFNTHRIVGVSYYDDQMVYLTQGDNRELCPIADSGYRKPSEIHYVYCFRIPKLGYLVDFLRKPSGFILLILLPQVAMVFLISFQIGRQIKNQKYRIESP